MRVCQDVSCEIDYPHYHKRDGDNLPSCWAATSEDAVVPLPWPERLNWQRPERRNTNGLFQFGWFVSHSKFQLPWKLDFSKLADDDWDALASIVAGKFSFSAAYGIPRGGTKFARALDKHCTPGYPIVIVDDVLTASRSFIHARSALGNPEGVFGVVVAARGRCPNWVFPILTVNEWAQSRATGLG